MRLRLPLYLHPDLPASSLLNKLTAIDPNLVFIRPRIIEGKTQSGIIYTRRSAPKVFGTIIGVPPSNPLFMDNEIAPGDLVMFTRYADQLVGYDKSILPTSHPDWTNYQHEIAAIHYSALECVLPYRERLEI